MDKTPETPAKRQFRFPTAFTILFGLIILVAALTWIVPAGQYQREMNEALDREVPVAGTYAETEPNPQGITDVLMAPIAGLYDPDSYQANAIDVAVFVLVIGGFIGVVAASGAINAGIGHAMTALAGREKWMIPVLMGLFALGGTTYGMAEETLDIYAPLAGRMGMQEMREELEDLSFQTLDPEAYAVVMQRLNELADRNRNLIEEIESELSARLASKGMTARVVGRRKRPFSIWTKMERKSVGFEQLSDIFGFRIVLGDVGACYRAVGIVHTTWPVVPGRFKDYISTPKQNDYRSIHTTVIGPGNQRVELQIRTEDMDQIAEYGIAAHALYKDGMGTPTDLVKRESNAFAWLRHTINMLSESANPEEFLEHTKLELFHDQVFCFTPKGKLIALPRQANVIDFAYAVHTDVGNSAVGCKINGKFAPLSSELQNGDEVEVLTSSVQTAPPSAWETLAITGKARAAIRRATRTAVKGQYATLGRRIVERLFMRAKIEYADDKLKGALPRLARASIEDVMASVGRGEMKASDVARAMYPDYKEERVNRFGEKKSLAVKLKLRSPKPPARPAAAIPIRGLRSDLPIKFAPNGGAVPGDRIVGIVSPGEGITIYPIQSPALKDFEEEPERWLDVRWDVDESTPQRFPARLFVENVNEPGSLAQIATVIAEHDGNIDNIGMFRRSPDFTELTIDLEVYDLKHLSAIIAQLRAKSVVSKVERVNG